MKYVKNAKRKVNPRSPFSANTKVHTLARLLIAPSIQSWHIFRRYRLKRVYRILRENKLHKLRLMILARLLYGKKIELVIDRYPFHSQRLWRRGGGVCRGLPCHKPMGLSHKVGEVFYRPLTHIFFYTFNDL